MVCVTVVAGIGETDLLLHLLTNVAPFKEVRDEGYMFVRQDSGVLSWCYWT